MIGNYARENVYQVDAVARVGMIFLKFRDAFRVLLTWTKIHLVE